MEKQTKKCQNCKKDFTIEPEDFAFYERFKVPVPTFCPQCRMIFRLNWRNERTLYWRKCDLCGEKILAIYDKDAPFPVYCNKCWYSDKWDPMKYGQDYDFKSPFFEQLRELKNRVPHLNLNVLNNKNCPYVNQVWNSKDIYMSFDVGYAENVMYSKACHFLKDSVDCTYSKKIELCYECINTKDSSRSIGLLNCQDCLDSYFLKNCRNCTHCILCVNLRNKKYHILNKPYSKEEFEKLKEEYIDGSFSKYEKARELFAELLNKSIHKENENLRAINCTGNYIWESKNCKHSFNVFRSEDCKFVNDIDSDLKDSMDVSHGGEGELIYNSLCAGAGSNMICNWVSVYSHNIQYSILCLRNNANLFGCLSLRNKQNCVLNKQYSKESFDKLRTKIIDHMNKMPYVDSKGRKFVYGDYFPLDLAPFAYNETTAQELFPITKAEAKQQGFQWKGLETKEHRPTIKAKDLPDHIKDVKDNILQEVIECANVSVANGLTPDVKHTTSGVKPSQFSQCTTAFKIIPQELEFYRKMNLPLPRLCPNCRHYQRIKQRNPLKLWKRQCQCVGSASSSQAGTNYVYQNTAKHFHGDKPCPNEFQTTYAPDRPEIVYCEACYLAEVV